MGSEDGAGAGADAGVGADAGSLEAGACLAADEGAVPAAWLGVEESLAPGCVPPSLDAQQLSSIEWNAIHRTSGRQSTRDRSGLDNVKLCSPVNSPLLPTLTPCFFHCERKQVDMTSSTIWKGDLLSWLSVHLAVGFGYKDLGLEAFDDRDDHTVRINDSTDSLEHKLQ